MRPCAPSWLSCWQKPFNAERRKRHETKCYAGDFEDYDTGGEEYFESELDTANINNILFYLSNNPVDKEKLLDMNEDDLTEYLYMKRVVKLNEAIANLNNLRKLEDGKSE